MKVLITGANGLTGQHLVYQAIHDPAIHQVIATSKGASRLPSHWNGYQYHSLDVTQPSEVRAAMQAHQPDVVIHTAALTQVDEAERERATAKELNTTAVGHLAQALQGTSTHLVHLSTDFVFDGEHGPYRETDEPHPISYYGETKLAAEQLLGQSTDLGYSIVRTVLVYGYAQALGRGNLVLWVRQALAEGQTLKIVNDQWRTPTYVGDLAAGCLLLAHRRAQGIFHVSGPEPLTPYQMATAVARHYQLDPGRITPVTAATFTQPARRPPKTGFVIDKMKALGYQPRSFQAGLHALEESKKALFQESPAAREGN